MKAFLMFSVLSTLLIPFTASAVLLSYFTGPSKAEIAGEFDPLQAWQVVYHCALFSKDQDSGKTLLETILAAAYDQPVAVTPDIDDHEMTSMIAQENPNYLKLNYDGQINVNGEPMRVSIGTTYLDPLDKLYVEFPDPSDKSVMISLHTNIAIPTLQYQQEFSQTKIVDAWGKTKTSPTFWRGVSIRNDDLADTKIPLYVTTKLEENKLSPITVDTSRYLNCLKRELAKVSKTVKEDEVGSDR